MGQLGHNFQVARGDAASPEVFTLIAGQTGLDRSAAQELIDQSSKTTGQYAVQAAGRKSLSIQVSGIRELPDASGLEAVYAQWSGATQQTAALFRIVDVSASPDAVVFEGSMYVSEFSQSDPDQDNSTYSFTLTLALAPTTDDLTP